MKRRNFISSLPLCGYSLAVLADGAGLQVESGRAPAPPEKIRHSFDRIAPAKIHRMAANERNMMLVDLEADVVVAGGGMAGVCAAVAAARNGAKVILVQDRSRLGGNSSSEVKMHIVGADMHTGRPGWRESGLIEEFRLDDAVNNPQRSFELWDLLLYDKVVSEPKITLLLDSVLFAAVTTNGSIEQVLVRNDKTEHLYRIKAKIYCDATGDSRLALEAGAELHTGREARNEFNESLAPEKADRQTLPPSILFTSRQYPQPMPFRPPKWARKVSKEQLRFRKLVSWEYGYWWIEWGGQISPIHDNDRIRFELLAIVMGVWDYIKNSGDHPSSANWAMDWVGMIPGKRGSRRIAGDHMLTQHDLMAGGDFEDAVAIGGWPMDDHPPSGFDSFDTPASTVVATPDVYNIPLRSLYSKNVGNLMMAGRNISASHVAFTSTRVMATCSVIGQAVGTAAALCSQYGMLPRQLCERENKVWELQQTLLRDDQTIRGLRNQDPQDLARRARITASAERDHAQAAFVINGYVRDIPNQELNHWAGKMGPDGAWIELAWDQPQRIREIQITFDTGFHRQLTLSAHDSTNRGVIRAPQPETVRDYTISAGPLKLVSVKGNHQRLNRHYVEPIETRAIRIHLTATNGDEYARIFEVRCYA